MLVYNDSKKRGRYLKLNNEYKLKINKEELTLLQYGEKIVQLLAVDGEEVLDEEPSALLGPADG